MIRVPSVVRLGAALLLASFAASTQAQSVTLAWDANPSPGIVGYRLYQGGDSGTYTNVIAVGNVTSNQVSGLIPGATYFFAATDYDTNSLESAFSNEISYTVPLTTNPPPTLSMTSPANGAVYTAPAAINLAAGVTANGHTITQVQFFNGATMLGSAASAPYSFSWTNVSAGTYSLSASLVYDSGNVMASLAVNITVAAIRPSSGLTFAADSGTLTAPFVTTNGTIYQPVSSGVTDGGEAAYSFGITNAGNYLVSAMVLAPNEGQNSFYVNIDAEPTDPLMIWDLPTGPTLTDCTVTWRGNGGPSAATAQYSPKVFSLSAGTHKLIIRGRESYTTLGTITIAATPPKLRMRWGTSGNTLVPASGTALTLSAAGQPGQSYSVMCSQDLKTWTSIGALTLDASGSAQFTDPAGSSRPSSYYRLQGQ
jgi:Bacterial Ig domain